MTKLRLVSGVTVWGDGFIGSDWQENFFRSLHRQDSGFHSPLNVDSERAHGIIETEQAECVISYDNKQPIILFLVGPQSGEFEYQVDLLSGFLDEYIDSEKPSVLLIGASGSSKRVGQLADDSRLKERIIKSVVMTESNVEEIKNEVVALIVEHQWLKMTNDFKAKLAARTESATIVEQIEPCLSVLKEGWMQGKADFKKFQANCEEIFEKNLPKTRQPGASEVLAGFMKGLCAGMILTLLVMAGLVVHGYVVGFLLSYIGLLTVTASLGHVQNALWIASGVAILGGLGGGHKLFKPALIADEETFKYVNELQSTVKSI